jgi:iron complex outermembrane receptor protein
MLLLALLPAVCLCWPTTLSHAQNGSASATIAEPASEQRQSVAESSRESGRIAGVLKDPSGAVVPGARIELKNPDSGFYRSTMSNGEGRFFFEGLPAWEYEVTVTVNGFDVAILHGLTVTAGKETAANVALKIAPTKTSIEVTEAASATAATDLLKVSDSDQARSRNAAELVGDTPGVSLRDNGQLASVPLLHGLGDERAKLVVNGMTVSSACANHMNPPLSYVAPSDAAGVTVMAGITPVSMGGDSMVERSQSIPVGPSSPAEANNCTRKAHSRAFIAAMARITVGH